MTRLNTQTTGDIGCIAGYLFYLLLVAVRTTYQWATGSDLREALVTSCGVVAWWTGGLVVTVLLVAFVWSAVRLKQGW